MIENLVNLIVKRLASDTLTLSEKFQESSRHVGVRYVEIDSLLPIELCNEIFLQFPKVENMRFMSSFREQKYTSKNFDEFDPILAEITFALQDPKVIKLIETITGIKNQTADPSLYAGGLSAMCKNNFLGPHIDNSHDGNRQLYRTLNLLYYVTPDWDVDYGGSLELWDPKVNDNVTIHSKFNRLVLMETTPSSWHSVSKVKSEQARYCVSNYYFSPQSPTGKDYFNVTSFSALRVIIESGV
jgi:Rps23 Pro-64 3,4-dihydroxylase Tpa1-like proline 4-hydroxylase